MAKKLVFSWGGKNHYNPQSENELITLWQSEAKHGLFIVEYGLQHKAALGYGEACNELGKALLHNLCCEGLAIDKGL